MKNDGHVVMKKSLAKALMEAGMHHYDGGGVIGGGGVLGDVGGAMHGLAGDFTVQNSYNANAPDMQAVTDNQNKLAGLLNQQANGAGPNPAQIQYQQNAEQIAQQSAARNSQNRALNPGLAARMSGMEAVNTQQNAASGAAAQQAQQQILAQKQLADLYAQQQNSALTAEGINAQVSQNNTNSVQQKQGQMGNSITQGIPIIGGMLGGFFAKGGEVPDHFKQIADIYTPKYATGGTVQAPNISNADVVAAMYSANSKKSVSPGAMPSSPGGDSGSAGSTFNLGIPGIDSGAASAGTTPDLGVAGLSSSAGGAAISDLGPAALALKQGGKVPGKASVKGDSYKNDNQTALLSPGEVVLPRSVTQSADAPKKAAEFMKAIMEHKGIDYKDVADAKKKSKGARK